MCDNFNIYKVSTVKLNAISAIWTEKPNHLTSIWTLSELGTTADTGDWQNKVPALMVAAQY